MAVLSVAVVIVALALAMTSAWALRMRTGRSGWIDAIWSAATGLVGVFAALSAAPPYGRPVLAAGVMLLWGARLAGHIAFRTHGAGDDPRYAELEREWGADFPRRLFLFLQIQAAASLPLAAAVALAARAPRAFPDVQDFLGLAIAAVGLAGEAVADAQLARFRRTAPRGSICEIGLWRYSRHPNYFFEFLFWCAWPVMAFDIAHPVQWLAFAAPLLMYGLLAHVSGVPPLETHMRASRGAAFEAYARRVNVFFPGPRREPS